MVDRIRDALTQASRSLTDSDSPRLDAEVLLAHALDKPRSYLHAWPQRELSDEALTRYRRLIERRRQGEPVAYLTGEREFWSLPLAVDDSTLIPRPETERLVELALARLPRDASLAVADLGTGSGAIALAIARERPRCRLIASDCNLDSLRLARRNARRLGIDRVAFAQGDWCAPFAPASLDLLLANPPYIASDDPHLRRGDVRFEPRRALAAGPQGLDAIQRIAQAAAQVLKPAAWLLLEHGFQQAEAVRNLLYDHGFEEISRFDDLAGRARVSGARRGR